MASNNKMTKKQQHTIISNIQNGDINQYALLINAYKNMVYTLVVRIVKINDDAEEITQDAFMTAYRKINLFNFQSAFSTWLYRIASNLAISHIRKKKIDFISIDQQDYTMEIDAKIDTIEDLNNIEKKELIQEAMEKLEREDAFLLTLYYYNECTIEDISEIVDYSKANIKIKLFRARKKLLKILNDILKEEIDILR